MSRYKKTLDAVLSGRRDTNVRFTDVRGLLLAIGFEEP